MITGLISAGIAIVLWAIVLMFFHSYIHEFGHKCAILKLYKKHGDTEPFTSIKVEVHSFIFSPYFKFLQENKNNEEIQSEIRVIAKNGYIFTRNFCMAICSLCYFLSYKILSHISYSSFGLDYSFNLFGLAMGLFGVILIVFVLEIFLFQRSSDGTYFKHPEQFIYSPEKHHDEKYTPQNTTGGQNAKCWKV